MTLETIQVQGADGTKHEVLADDILNQNYAMPIYKLAIGAEGVDDGLISAANPLPVVQDTKNAISVLNSRAAATLAAAAVFQGVGEDVSAYGRVGVSIVSDNATDGILTMEVSRDGVTWGGPTRNFADTRFSEPHMWNIVEQYFRIKYTNGTTEATNLEIQVQYSVNADILLGHQLDASLINETEAIITRSVLVGQTQGGIYVNVPVSSQGHLQLDVPQTAYGEVGVAEKTPEVQVKFSAGINTDIVQILKNKSGSSVTATEGLCTITAAGVAESFAQIRSLDVIRYGAGQGLDARFAVAFTAGVANSSQWAGPGDDDEMIGVGYDETAFGVLHRSFGELEVRDLTITAGGDAGGGTFTLTLDGTAITITVPAGSATIADVVALIVAASDDVFNAGRGWEVHTDDSITVTFISLVAENATGTFSFADVDSGVTAGTFEQATTVLEGIPPTEVIVPQASWNIDILDGTGVSGMTLDPTKINIFDISFQYSGNIYFAVENPATGRLEPVHMVQYAGNRTTPTFREPTFHINAISKTEVGYVGGALTITTPSCAGFIEGKESPLGVRHTTSASVATNGTTEVVNLVLHNEEQFNGTRNKVESFIDNLTLINDSTRSIRVDVYKNPTHINSGVALSSVGGTSAMAAGAGTGTRTGGTLLLTVSVTASESKDLNVRHLGLKVRPTETFVFVVTKKTGGTDGAVTVSPSWIERG